MKNRKIFGVAAVALFSLMLIFGNTAMATDSGMKCCPTKDAKICQKADSKACQGNVKCPSVCTDESNASACPGSSRCGKHDSGDKCCPAMGDTDKPCCPQASDPSCCPTKTEPGSKDDSSI